MCPNLPIKVDVFVDLYFHQVLTLTEAANFCSTVLGDKEMEAESENETISSVSSLNISTNLMLTTASPCSTAASSPQLPSEVSDSFSDSKATIANNNFTSAEQRVIRIRGGLRRTVCRGARTRGGRAHQAVEPQATADIPSWSDTVRTKRRFNFQGIPGVHPEPYDPSSSLAFL